MDAFRVEAGGRRIELGRGYALRTPGLTGRGAFFPTTPDAPPSRAPNPTSPELAEAFERTGVREAATVALDVGAAPAPPEAPDVRSPAGDDALELQVPDLGPERGQVVMAVAEDGAVSWHFPVAEDGESVAPPGTRSGDGTRRFLIPRRVVPPPDEPAEHRGFVGAVGRKLLKVLVYPVSDPVLGAVGRGFAGAWEARNRPYRVRSFGPEEYTVPAERGLETEEWQELAGGRALLFVHGTFSTSHGAFGRIPREVMEELHDHYGGRVFAFDTYTLSEDPAQNARWFMDRVPEGLGLEVDVVCHSRGGLVARQIAEGRTPARPGGGEVDVGRIVFVGVPNGGTALADPENLVSMLDRMTSVLLLFPSGPVTETMEGILTVVKVLARGAVSGLPGLAAMRPGGPFLESLNAAAEGGAEYYAITADFEPRGGALASLLKAGAADAVADRVFRDEANDLVVPTDGVHRIGGAPLFPLPEERVLRFDAGEGVVHTTYFDAPGTARALRSWLTA